MNYMINGPNNAIRLTNNDKILYIFGDVHLDENMQTECPFNDEYDSIDLDMLLFKFMKNEKKREFDLFTEIYNTSLIPESNNTNRQKYIHKISKLFKNNINIINNKILTNRKYNNFRFHYFDIRNAFDVWYQIIDYHYIYFNFPYDEYACNNIKDVTLTLLTNLINFKDYIRKDTENKILNKILNKYENKNIKKIINKIYKEIFIKQLSILIKNSKELINLINIILDKSYNKIACNWHTAGKFINIAKPIFIKFEDHKNDIMNLLTLLTDLFFIRRFLDKSYIKNGILYTGLAHFADITNLLTTYFDFKITNVYYTNKLYQNKLTKMKTNTFLYLNTLTQYYLQYDNNFKINQCVNLLDFPENFS